MCLCERHPVPRGPYWLFFVAKLTIRHNWVTNFETHGSSINRGIERHGRSRTCRAEDHTTNRYTTPSTDVRWHCRRIYYGTMCLADAGFILKRNTRYARFYILDRKKKYSIANLLFRGITKCSVISYFVRIYRLQLRAVSSMVNGNPRQARKAIFTPPTYILRTSLNTPYCGFSQPRDDGDIRRYGKG